LQLGDAGDAGARQLALHHLADAIDGADRPRRQEALRLGATDGGKAARLVEIGSELGEELVVRQADRDGDADLLLDRQRAIRG